MKLSIIIISKDCENDLQETIVSCSNLFSEHKVEFTFIDSSQDSEFVKYVIDSTCKSCNRINYRYQEPSGIYEAMNLGVKESIGEFVWFVNAGDKVNPDLPFEEIYNNLRNTNVVFFSSVYCWAYLYSPALFSFPSHQEIIYPRSFAVRNPFLAEEYPIAADMVHKILLRRLGGLKFIRSKKPLTLPQQFGVSADFSSYQIVQTRKIELLRLVKQYLLLSFGWIFIAKLFLSNLIRLLKCQH